MRLTDLGSPTGRNSLYRTVISAKMMAQYNIFVRLVVVSIEILAVYVGLSCIFKVNYINEMLNRILGKFKRA